MRHIRSVSNDYKLETREEEI